MVGEDEDFLDMIDTSTKIPKWLVIAKAIRETLPIIVGIIIAFFAYKSYDASNSVLLGGLLNDAQNKIDIQRSQIDTLKEIVDNYKANRFIIRDQEAHSIMPGIYIEFDGRRPGDFYVKRWKETILKKGTGVGEPYYFSIDNDSLYIIIERRFEGPEKVDSLLFYWDLIDKDKSQSTTLDNITARKQIKEFYILNPDYAGSSSGNDLVELLLEKPILESNNPDLMKAYAEFLYSYKAKMDTLEVMFLKKEFVDTTTELYKGLHGNEER